MSSTQPSTQPNRVLILGGGFSCMRCALELAPHPDVQVTLIDRHNYQQFHPLLYQVAASLLSPDNAAFAYRDLLGAYSNVDIRMEEVTSVDLTSRTAHTASGAEITAEYIVLATGAKANFFGIPGAEAYALPLYTLVEAETLRSRILSMFEAADRAAEGPGKQLHFVIVGGGPTGVEMAGTLADMLQDVLRREFRHVDAGQATITLLERGPVVLAMFSAASQTYATRALEQRGVAVRVRTAVTEVGADFVRLEDGSTLPASLVIWSAGIRAATIPLQPQSAQERDGRLDVAPDLALRSYPAVFAAGDVADALDSSNRALPQLAAVAQQAGVHCARNILALAHRKPTTPFVYSDRGILAMIGRNAAVSELGAEHHELSGPLAYAVWLAVHALLLTTNRARAEAVFEWAWNYFTRQRPAQLIDA